MSLIDEAGRQAALKAVSKQNAIKVVDSGECFYGLFKYDYVDTLDIASRVPTLKMTDIDYACLELEKDKDLLINGETFRIKEKQPDTYGFVLLILELQ